MKAYSQMTIGLASDHGGFNLKQKVQLFLEDSGAKVIDYGCYSAESCDYPDFGHKMAEAVSSGECDYGVAICSTGNGINMVCNKHHGIRAAVCWDTPLAVLAREHNNANVLSMPGSYLSVPKALEVVNTFFTTNFAGDQPEGERHKRRVEKIHLH